MKKRRNRRIPKKHVHIYTREKKVIKSDFFTTCVVDDSGKMRKYICPKFTKKISSRNLRII